MKSARQNALLYHKSFMRDNLFPSMPQKRTLTHNEKIVFYNLVRYPVLNDREISERTDIKLSTVTAIRRRLQAASLFSTYRMPDFQKLGLELMFIGYGPISEGESRINSAKLCEQAFNTSQELFFASHSLDSAFFIGVAENYTAAKRTIESLQHIFASQDLTDAWTYAFFPFEMSSMLNLFDCSTLLEVTFGLEEEKKGVDISFKGKTPIHLTTKEKKVLKKLVELPNASDNLVASKVGASRQGVSVMRKRFYDSGLLRTIRIPNFQKLNFEIFILAHSTFNPRLTLHERSVGISFMMKEAPQIFMVSGNFENVLLAVSKNFEEFTAAKNEIVRLYRQHDFMRKEPSLLLLPFKEMRTVKNHDYVPILDKLWKD